MIYLMMVYETSKVNRGVRVAFYSYLSMVVTILRMYFLTRTLRTTSIITYAARRGFTPPPEHTSKKVQKVVFVHFPLPFYIGSML
jgi:hypothetical protein